MRRYLQFILQHRSLALAAILLVTLAAGYTITKGVIASSVIKLFFGDNPEYGAYRKLADEFGGSDVMVIAFEDERLLTKDGIQRLRRITEAIDALPDIVSVDSLINASRIRAEGDDLIIEPYVDQLDAETASSAEALRTELIKDPLISGLLISKDGRAFAVLAELGADPDRPIEAVPQILSDVVGCFLKEGYPRERLHLAGLVPESTEATVQAKYTLMRIFPFTVLLLAAVVFLLFLRIWPVLITGGVALISIIWTLAFAILLDPKVNLLMAMVPGMMTVIAFSDIIHLYSAYVRERMRGLSAHEAVLKSGSEVGVACLYTSMTTFVGFASIAFVPTPVLRQLGVVLGVGVAIALLLALTLVPIILSMIKAHPAKEAPRLESERAGRLLDSVVGACLRLSTRRPALTLGLFGAVILLSLWGISRIEVEASFARRLSENNHIRRAQRFIEERFAAANFLDLYLISEEGALLEEGRYAKIEALTRKLSELPDVQRVLSLTQLVERLHGAMAQKTKTSEALAQSLLLFEVSGGEGLRRFINEERTIFRLSLRLGSDGMRKNAEVGNQAAAMAEAALGPGVRAKPTGITYLFGDWLTFIIEGQKRGLLFAILSTTLMMVFCLRSLRVGILSMLPNLLPLLVLGGYVGLVWERVDSDTILIATFAIGIAVDDTIHFLTRLRYESLEASSVEQALERTFFFTGRAIVQTTVILCLGFLPFALSDYFSTQIIGTLLPLTLVVALVADLLMVPALVQLGVLRFNRS